MLRLHGTARICAAFFRAACLPSAVRVSVHCFPDKLQQPTPVLTVPNLLRFAAATEQASKGPPRFAALRSVSIHEFTYFWRLCGWRSRIELAVQCEIESLKPDVVLYIRRGTVGDDLRAILETLPLHETKVLYFSDFPWRNSELRAIFDCARALCNMPQLLSLTIDFTIWPLICDILETTSAAEVTVSMEFHEAGSRKLRQYGRELTRKSGGEICYRFSCGIDSLTAILQRRSNTMALFAT